MIVPVIFSLAPNTRDLMYEWVFLKGITFARQNNSAVIAQEQYFNSDAVIRRYYAAYYESEEIAAYNGYDLPKPGDFQKVRAFQIPKQIERDFIARYPSETDAFLATDHTAWPEMEAFLIASLQEAERQCGEKVEAITTLCDYQFLRNVAERMQIRILYFEMGAFRLPTYRQTAYLDLKGLHGNASFQERLQAFIPKQNAVPILTRSELLALFLRPDSLHYALPTPAEPSYELGIALGYSTVLSFSSRNAVTSVEMVTRAQRVFDDRDFCVRYHPGDPVGARMQVTESSAVNTVDFILQCKRILCATSNVAYEAMLYNRYAYDVGWSQYDCLVNHSLEQLEDRMPTDAQMSFVAFGYHIPFELLMDMEYLRYRLSEPDEAALYQYHLHYYLNCLGIDKAVLDLPPEERLQAILRARGYQGAVQGRNYSNDAIWMQCSMAARQEIAIFRLKEQLAKLQADKNAQGQMLQDQTRQMAAAAKQLAQCSASLQETAALAESQAQELARVNRALQEVLNSTSYRITKPLRSMMRLLRKS